MRKKLLKLLREIEDTTESNYYRNSYSEYDEESDRGFLVNERMDFPDYTFVIKKYNDIFPVGKKNNIISKNLNNGVMAELKRMESDNLIMIGVQEGMRYVNPEEEDGHDYDGGSKFTTESVVLTTKGKSNWRYLVYETTKNPVTTILSIIAIIISFIAIFK